MNQPEIPTPWQRRIVWRALTSLAVAAIFAVAVGFIYAFSWVMGVLQPILVPFAIAGVLAYLLDPLVVRLVRLGTTRARAVTAVFVVTTLAFVGVLFWIIPIISTQTEKLAGRLPVYTYQVRLGIANFAKRMRENYGLQLLPEEMMVVPKPRPKKAPTPPPGDHPADHPEISAPGAEPPPASATPPVAGIAAPPAGDPIASVAPAATPPATGAAAVEPAKIPPLAPGSATVRATDKKLPAEKVATKASEQAAPEENPIQKLASGDWIQDAMPAVWNFISKSLGGFLGFFGFLLSLFIVPLYLFYFLAESDTISKSWSKYLPLKASAFKDEVVGSLTEINGYLIAFFRGQLVVSMINGVATGVLLGIAGLDFGILIGFALCFLGIIPYLGIIICWLPAVVIASVQEGSWIVSANAAWWVFPLIVTGIFTVVQQVDGLFITPKIVGERVGLHPVTVIFSVFLWTVLLGGLLGAILAVPMTATMKVILKRYVWERTIMADPEPALPPISEK